MSYGIITAAKNEEKYIQATINSVTNQSILPDVWVIVDDGSTDGTRDIIMNYLIEYEFIKLVCLGKETGRTVASKVKAIDEGYKFLQKYNLTYIGILDADIALPVNYYQNMILELEKKPELGVIGGTMIEIRNGKKEKSSSGVHHVIGAVQFFRKSCYDEIGGIPKIDTVGEDSAALIAARANGWQTKTVRNIEFEHLKPKGVTIVGSLKKSYRLGVGDFSLGVIWIFAIVKGIRRLFWKPYFLFGLGYLAGFVHANIKGNRRQLSSEYITYYKREQIQRISNIFKVSVE